jgi:hypothetical protein
MDRRGRALFGRHRPSGRRLAEDRRVEHGAGRPAPDLDDPKTDREGLRL